MDALITILAIALICPAMMISCGLLTVVKRVVSRRRNDGKDDR